MRPDTAASIENGQRHLDERGRRKVVNIDQAPSVEQSSGTTEDAIALEFVRRNGRDFLYVPNVGFHAWSGQRWARDIRLRHFEAARHVCRELADHVVPTSGKRRIRSAKTVAAVVQLVRSDPRIVRTMDELDADPLLLNSPAGIIDLRTGLVRPHDRDLVTRITAVSPTPGAPCAHWTKFLQDVFEGDSDVITFMRRFLGYCLTGLTREHLIAFLFGGGANGKSTLLDLVLWLMGDYALKLPASVLMAQRGERHPTEIAQLCGVRLAISNEIDEGEFWAESRLKELTGDTHATARYMRGDFFTFAVTHKHIIAGNHRPQVRAMDEALKRRMALVPFSAFFRGQHRDPQMLGKLKGEGAEVLGWLIQGASEWLEHGIDVPAAIRTASDEYASTMDALGNWIDDRCEREPDGTEAAKLLYRSYADWKRDRGEHPVSETRWSEQLVSRGFERYRSNGSLTGTAASDSTAMSAIESRRETGRERTQRTPSDTRTTYTHYAYAHARDTRKREGVSEPVRDS